MKKIKLSKVSVRSWNTFVAVAPPPASSDQGQGLVVQPTNQRQAEGLTPPSPL
jgi:hypothetical protein